jgi:hypothetical protein
VAEFPAPYHLAGFILLVRAVLFDPARDEETAYWAYAREILCHFFPEDFTRSTDASIINPALQFRLANRGDAEHLKAWFVREAAEVIEGLMSC